MIGKHTFSQKRRFGTRFRQTVTTNPFLSQNDAERNLREKRRFGPRVRQTVVTNPISTQNEAKRNLHRETSFFIDLEKQ